MKHLDEFKNKIEQGLIKIPRWACVAFAARCARWSQTIYHREHFAAIEQLITVSEQSAARAKITDTIAPTGLHPIEIAEDFIAQCNAKAEAIDMDQPNAFADRGSALYPAYCFNAAVQAWTAVNNAYDKDKAVSATIEVALHTIRSADAYSDSFDTGAAEHSHMEASAIASNFLDYLMSDLLLLEHLSEEEDWSDDTAVEPEIFGPFEIIDQMDVWPVATLIDKQFDLDFEIPDGVSEADVKRRLVELAKELDNYYCLLGGNGLEVSEVEIFDEARVPAGGGA